MPLKIAILLILLSVPLNANASDEKGWYPFLQNKGWYGWEGQSSSTSSGGASTGDKEQPLVQPTTQPGSGQAQSTGNTQSQTGNQQMQSNWYK